MVIMVKKEKSNMTAIIDLNVTKDGSYDHM